jgi:hypothetical protein
VASLPYVATCVHRLFHAEAFQPSPEPTHPTCHQHLLYPLSAPSCRTVYHAPLTPRNPILMVHPRPALVVPIWHHHLCDPTSSLQNLSNSQVSVIRPGHTILTAAPPQGPFVWGAGLFLPILLQVFLQVCYPIPSSVESIHFQHPPPISRLHPPATITCASPLCTIPNASTMQCTSHEYNTPHTHTLMCSTHTLPPISPFPRLLRALSIPQAVCQHAHMHPTPTCQHHLCVAPLHHPERITNAVHPSGTRSGHSMVGTPADVRVKSRHVGCQPACAVCIASNCPWANFA